MHQNVFTGFLFVKKRVTVFLKYQFKIKNVISLKIYIQIKSITKTKVSTQQIIFEMYS